MADCLLDALLRPRASRLTQPTAASLCCRLRLAAQGPAATGYRLPGGVITDAIEA
jgi:hypothetical protein